jgi:isopenicillin-N epimerase
VSGTPGLSAAAIPELGKAPLGHGLRAHWSLEPDMRFLNHGSFGATPRTVLAEQQAWRDRMERQPVRFMTSELPGLLRAAAGELAGFLGVRGEDLAFVENATAGVNAVLRSIAFRSGERIVLSRYAYPAVRNAVLQRCRETGAVPAEAAVPFPIEDAREIVAAFATALAPGARLAIADHVSSPLAIVQPLREIAGLCREHGLPLLIDGAHAPGMLDLRIGETGADWYVGNCHKWLFAPKGSAFLWAAPHVQAGLHPPVISNRWGEGFVAEFDWTGTRDPSAWLATPAAIAFLRGIGVERYRAYIAGLARDAARALAQGWQVALPAPEAMSAAMVTLPVPEALGAIRDDAARVHDALWERWRIEVPVSDFDGRLWLRISGQVYNEAADYAALEAPVLELAAEAGR